MRTRGCRSCAVGKAMRADTTSKDHVPAATNGGYIADWCALQKEQLNAEAPQSLLSLPNSGFSTWGRTRDLRINSGLQALARLRHKTTNPS